MNFLSWVMAIGIVVLVIVFAINQVMTIVYRIKHKGYAKKDLMEVLDRLNEIVESEKENKKEEVKS